MPTGARTLPIHPFHDPLFSAYIAEAKKIPTLTSEEERELLTKAKAGDRKAINSLVSANLRFVIAVCWNYRHLDLPMPDLVNEGNLALFRAIENFRPSGVRFLSYAVWWVRHGILSAVARQAGAVSYPPNRMHQIIHFRRIESALAQRLGRKPDLDELAMATGRSRNALGAIASVSNGLSSTRNRRTASADDMHLLAVQDEDSDPEASAARYLRSKAVGKRLAGLAPRERQVLTLRYGLGHGVSFSLGEVSSLLRISRERVRQIEAHAIALLRAPIKLGALKKSGGAVLTKSPE